MKNREKWFKNRLRMEQGGLKTSPLKIKEVKRYDLFGLFIRFLKSFLYLIFPFYNRLKEEALELELTEIQHEFETLPSSFNNYKILHLSDLHMDERPEMIDKIIQSISESKFDLAVITGDFFTKSFDSTPVLNQLEKLIHHLLKKSEVYAVLGNHDSCELVPILQSLGVKVLINESSIIKKEKQSIQIIGTDDVHYFFTKDSLRILESGSNYFSIALVHSSEIFDKAAKNNIDLYLCGHSHGGQICLFKNKPIIKRVKRGRSFCSGKWNYEGMIGYTSKGVGTSTLAIRFNCQAEVTIHHLILRD